MSHEEAKKPEASTSSSANSARNMTFSTINAYCFPEIYNWVLKIFKVDLHPRTSQPIKVRLRLLAKEIRKQNSDVVCLQEVWCTKNKNFLIGLLKNLYPYHCFKSDWRNRAFMIGVDSGLLILSRMPIVRHKMQPFSEYTKRSDETFAKKGVLCAQVNAGNGNLVIVANTHLQAGCAAAGDITRKKQVTEMAACIDAFVDSCKQQSHSEADGEGGEASVIAMGDFNAAMVFRKESGEWDTSKKKYIDNVFGNFNAKLSSESMHAALPTADDPGPKHTDFEGRAILDHIFTSPGIALAQLEINVGVTGRTHGVKITDKNARKDKLITDHAVVSFVSSIQYSLL